jgi:hypothetical protein
LKYNQNLIATIEQIGIQLSQTQETLTFHVYHTSQAERIATVIVSPSKAGSFEWFIPESSLILHNLTDAYSSGGAFYIMYDQDELVGQAIDARYNFTTAPCSCNPWAYKNWNKRSRFFSIRSCYIEAGDRPGSVAEMFDIRKVKYAATNYGINFDVTAKCDLTQFLIRQKSVFAPAIRDMVIIRLLEQMRNSTRQNGVDEKVKQLAAFALQARSVGGGGMIEQLDRKIKTIDFEISALDSVCMPCANRPGVKHTAFGLS